MIKKYAVILPGSASPAPAGQSSRDCSGRRTAPSGPGAPLGSSRRTAAAGTVPSAVSGASRSGRRWRCWRRCRCRTRGRLRGWAAGAPKPAESRRAASGTAREWRGARRPPQVRKAGAPAGGRLPASGPRTAAPRSAALCVPRWTGPAWAAPSRAMPRSSLLLVPRFPGP